MNKKLLSLAAAALLVGGLSFVASPAEAATAKKASMHKSHHKMSCYDQAWESQAMKDCLAKAEAKPAAKKAMKKGKKKAKTTS